MVSYIEQVQRAVCSWKGVSLAPHRFGGVEFKWAKAEIGHIHRNGLLDVPFPIPVRDQLLLEGSASKHHVLPNSGWVSFQIRSEADVRHAIWLLKLSYLRYLLGQARRSLTQKDQGTSPAVQELKALNLSAGLTAALERAMPSPKEGS